MGRISGFSKVRVAEVTGGVESTVLVTGGCMVVVSWGFAKCSTNREFEGRGDGFEDSRVEELGEL